MKIKLYIFLYILGFLAINSSCNKKNDYTSNVEVVREWKLNLSSANQNVVTTGAPANAVFNMVALADNSLRYEIKGDTSSSDRIVAAQIRLGDPLSEGALLVSLPVRVYGTYASGTLTGLSTGLMDTLRNNAIEKYITVTSDRAPSGLVRGQLNSNIVFSKNVSLTGGAVIPSVTTTTNGTAFLRITSDSVLHSRVVINNNDVSDPVLNATINQGAASANGPLLLNLAASGSEFNVSKRMQLTGSAYSALLNNNTYVTVNSTLYPSGKLRGQIR
ncbi:MAG: domain containing protein [Segetibacter sp.]|jgi:hypothetical protein|nr:domain containing protein [Segetibacter sp.]